MNVFFSPHEQVHALRQHQRSKVRHLQKLNLTQIRSTLNYLWKSFIYHKRTCPLPPTLNHTRVCLDSSPSLSPRHMTAAAFRDRQAAGLCCDSALRQSADSTVALTAGGDGEPNKDKWIGEGERASDKVGCLVSAPSKQPGCPRVSSWSQNRLTSLPPPPTRHQLWAHTHSAFLTPTLFFPPGVTRAKRFVPSTATAISTNRVITCDGHRVQHLGCGKADTDCM